jgi:hypothetical protein
VRGPGASGAAVAAVSTAARRSSRSCPEKRQATNAATRLSAAATPVVAVRPNAGSSRKPPNTEPATAPIVLMA